MFARLLLVPALLAATPAGAQTTPTQDPLAVVGRWVGKLSAISADPAAASAACGPQFGRAVGAVRDAASARAAATEIRPCMGQIRAAYRRSADALAQVQPLPADIEAAAQFDTRRFVEDQRRQFVAALAYMDDLDAFLAKMAANDRAGAMQALPKVRAGGAALVDGTILQLRAYQGIARLAFSRDAIELRIVVAEASKLPMIGAVGPAGFAIGGELKALAPRARAAAAAVRTSWEQDKTSLRALVGGDAAIEKVIDPAAAVVENIALSGDQIAAALQRAGSRPSVSTTEVVALLNELNGYEVALAKSIQDFAQTLQTIGK